ncbi:hypothetical protein K438DRAFT_1994873 [Mycena galopus ATCC 62051]|nr:hypothetical protein K438DRAFT_1994873 [Mycena galopus ATCC 62051]
MRRGTTTTVREDAALLGFDVDSDRPFLAVKDASRVYGLHGRRRRDHDTLHRTYRARVPALLLLLPVRILLVLILRHSPSRCRASTAAPPLSLPLFPPGHTYARTSAFGQHPILTHCPLPHPLHPTPNPAAGPQDGRTASAPWRARTRSSTHRVSK